MSDDMSKYVVTESTAFASDDADLDHADYRYADGTPITEKNTEAFTVERKRSAGRPALGSAAGSSPSVAFRLTAELRQEAEALAEREGRRVSAIARQALEEYIANHRAS